MTEEIKESRKASETVEAINFVIKAQFFQLHKLISKKSTTNTIILAGKSNMGSKWYHQSNHIVRFFLFFSFTVLRERKLIRIELNGTTLHNYDRNSIETFRKSYWAFSQIIQACGELSL